jgi:alpha-L-rhamnosidase
MFNNGPGTIWERWNSDGAIGSGMNSLNHVMYGAGPGTWVYKSVGGISSLKPGYEEILIKPDVNSLTYAKGSIETVRGTVSTDWKIETDNTFALAVSIPCNSKAAICIPKRNANEDWAIMESQGACWEEGTFVGGVPGITAGEDHDTYVLFRTGSGKYQFRAGPSSVVSTMLRTPDMKLQPVSIDGHNGQIQIRYVLTGERDGVSQVSLRIYNIQGRCLAEPVNTLQKAGNHTIVWKCPSGRLCPGTYICMFKMNASTRIVKKFLVVNES